MWPWLSIPRLPAPPHPTPDINRWSRWESGRRSAVRQISTESETPSCVHLTPLYQCNLYSSWSQPSLTVILYHMKLTSDIVLFLMMLLELGPSPLCSFYPSISSNCTPHLRPCSKFYLLHNVYLPTVINSVLHWSFIPSALKLIMKLL